MLVTGRGSIAHVQYTGDEAAADIKRLLDDVVANEDSFEQWEKLVARASELEGGVTRNSSPSAIDLVRNVFDCLLAKFPLFFGYWKKYADLEFSIGGTETAEMVYERGVSCIPISVDLWTHYCGFKMETCHDNDTIRELFERGAEFVGLDFQSHLFWDKYIELEERVNGVANITRIHSRLTHVPMYQFDRYYQKFRSFITVRPVEELMGSDELEVLKTEIHAENPGRPEIELDRLLRAKIDARYYEIYVRTQAEVTKRWTYEGNIKRGYFHVTELDEAELTNWQNYLDFEEAEGDYKRTSFLYERCLVVCATHTEFWLRYARWMFAQGKDEDTRIIYMKASCIFAPIAEPTVRLHWARFEEKLGRIQIARDIHLAILEELADNVETIISLAGLERRHQGDQAATQLLENYANQRDAQVAGLLTAEQARISWQCSGDVDKARQLFFDRCDRFLESQDFWLSFLKFEIDQLPVDEKEAHARIKKVHTLMRAKARFSQATTKVLSRYYMEYLLNRGGKQAAEEYMLLDKEVNGAQPLDSMKANAADDGKEGPGQRRVVPANGYPAAK